MLKTLELNYFTIFSKASLKFSKGLNVIVGENGSGKTHLLKLAYAILRILSTYKDKDPVKEVLERQIANSLVDIFRPDVLGRLASRVQGQSTCSISLQWGKEGNLTFSFSTRNTEKVNIEELKFEKLPASSLFIPPKEILSIYTGFQGALESRELPFDATYLDLTKALNPAPLKGPRLTSIKVYLDQITKLLKANVIKSDGAFYFSSTQNKGIIEAHLVAEGHRKIGSIAYLLLTGGLQKNSSFFWDEPESNLNPKLLLALANILVELSKVMQITIATHSLFLLRELEIIQEGAKIHDVNYFGLNFDGGVVQINSGPTSNDIGDITTLDENIAQSERYMNLAYQE